VAPRNPSASSKDNPDAVENHNNKMLELPGYAENFIHVMFHLWDFLKDMTFWFDSKPPQLTWIDCNKKEPAELYPL